MQEKNKFLKNTIRRFERLRTMFCNYFDQNINMKAYLQELINNAQPEQGQDERFGMMYHRLVNDKRSIALFDWIAEREAAKDVSESLHAINTVSASLIKGGTKCFWTQNETLSLRTFTIKKECFLKMKTNVSYWKVWFLMSGIGKFRCIRS